MDKTMFIVSAKQFRNVIHDLNPENYDKYDDVFIIGEGKKLFFKDLPDRQLDVEMRGPAFRSMLTGKQLRRFYRILGILEDQPLTITIDGNSWINFHAVI